MKRFAIVLTLLAMCSAVSLAEDGGAIYKSKCAACHGAGGEGKMGPALKGTAMTDAKIAEFVTKGEAAKKAPHAKGMSGVTEDQAKAVAEFVKTLK